MDDQSSIHEGSRKGSMAITKRKIYFNFKKELAKMTHHFKKNRTELFKSMLMGRAIQNYNRGKKNAHNHHNNEMSNSNLSARGGGKGLKSS